MAEEGEFVSVHLFGSVDDSIKDVQNNPLADCLHLQSAHFSITLVTTKSKSVSKDNRGFSGVLRSTIGIKDEKK